MNPMFPKLALLALVALSMPAQSSDEAVVSGDWVRYAVPGEGSPLHALETLEAIAGLTVTVTCTLRDERIVEEILLHNSGFAEIPAGSSFDVTFVFAQDDLRRHVDTALRADPRHESLTVAGSQTALLAGMRDYQSVTISQGDVEVTESPVPLNGFAEGLDAMRQICGKD